MGASKRKSPETDASSPPKRSRTDADPPDDPNNALDYYQDIDEDAPEDDVVNFTDKGGVRADSEARRAWNFVCEYCGQRFNRPTRLEQHRRTHTNERPYVCTYQDCGRAFARKDHLQRHFKSVHTELERNYVCDWDDCGKTFTSQGRLQRHRDRHASKLLCTGYPPCKAVFRKQKTLEEHIQKVHLNANPYRCTYIDPESGEECGNTYQSRSGLQRHVDNFHEKVVTDQYFCMICIPPGTEFDTIQNDEGELVPVPKQPLCFATAQDLEAHNAEAHVPRCDICGRTFKHRKNLKDHVQTVHADPETVEIFQCPICEKTFSKKSNCKTHIEQVHEKQEKFACSPDAMLHSKHADLAAWDGENACDKRFKTKSSLEQHIRILHLGLQNRKDTRKATKPRKKLLPEPTALSLLTGVGYEEGRPVPCLVRGCEVRFVMDRDLKRHLKATHEYTDSDIEVALLERDAEAGGQFWIGGMEEHDSTPLPDSVAPSMPETPMHSQDDRSFLLTAQDETPKGCEPLFHTDGAFMGSMDTLGLPDDGIFIPGLVPAGESWDILSQLQGNSF